MKIILTTKKIVINLYMLLSDPPMKNHTLDLLRCCVINKYTTKNV